MNYNFIILTVAMSIVVGSKTCDAAQAVITAPREVIQRAREVKQRFDEAEQNRERTHEAFKNARSAYEAVAVHMTSPHDRLVLMKSDLSKDCNHKVELYLQACRDLERISRELEQYRLPCCTGAWQEGVYPEEDFRS